MSTIRSKFVQIWVLQGQNVHIKVKIRPNLGFSGQMFIVRSKFVLILVLQGQNVHNKVQICPNFGFTRSTCSQ